MTKLNSILSGLVAAIGFTAAASAQEATIFDTSSLQSTKTRAEVRAEAAAALAAGQLPQGEVSYGYAFTDAAAAPSLSRAQVVAEAREAQRLGVLASGERSLIISPAQAEQIRIAGLKAADMPLAAKR